MEALEDALEQEDEQLGQVQVFRVGKRNNNEVYHNLRMLFGVKNFSQSIAR